MSFQQRLTEDMKQAMRARDAKKLEVIRFLMAEIKNTQIDKGDLTDEDVIQIIMRQVKQLNEAIADYTKAGRDELVEQEQSKIEILKEYLPAQMSDQELDQAIDEVMSQDSDLNMGQVIGAVKQKVGSAADGSRIAARVKNKFS